MSGLDCAIINSLQGGLPICEHPYRVAAERLGISEGLLIERLNSLLVEGVLSRFGPMYNAERLGGALTLSAMSVPEHRYDAVTALVNAHPEIAHNYRREHAWNMWFVIATDAPARIDAVISAIETETGLTVLNLPKQREFFVGLHWHLESARG